MGAAARAFVAESLLEAQPAPPTSWPDRLFRRLFGSRLSLTLTVLGSVVALAILIPLAQWAVLDAVWSGGVEACRQEAAGACWAAIADKARLIVFGVLPPVGVWRGAVIIAALALLLGVSTVRRLQGRRLLAAWAFLALAAPILLGGSALGLEPIPARMWSGLPLTIILSVFAVILSFPLAILLSLGRADGLPVVRWLCTTLIEAVRGVPLLMLIFMGYLIVPLFFPEGLTPGVLVRAQIAVVLFYVVMNAEVIRGGLQAVGPGQHDAALALGLGYWQRNVLVVVPQALKAVAPALITNTILAVKDTSLVAIIGLIDLYSAARISTQDITWGNVNFETYLFVSGIYLVICLVLAKIGEDLARRTA